MSLYESENCDEIREKCREKFYKLLKSRRVSSAIEESVYDNFGNDKRQYLHKLVSLYMNLNKRSKLGNRYLLKQVRDKAIDLKNIALMTPQELFPDHWTDIIRKNELNKEFLYKKQEEAFTTLYTCGRCKQNKASYFLKQVRSADEATTVFFTCLNCGNKWRRN